MVQAKLWNNQSHDKFVKEGKPTCYKLKSKQMFIIAYIPNLSPEEREIVILKQRKIRINNKIESYIQDTSTTLERSQPPSDHPPKLPASITNKSHYKRAQSP